MKLLFALALGFVPALIAANPELSAKATFKAAVENYDKDHLAALGYSYNETDTNQAGVTLFHGAMMEGTPYERLIGKDGKPLTPEAEKREDEKFRRALSERANETNAEREKRTRKYRTNVKIFQEAPDAFQVKQLADETVAGRPAYVLELTPDPEYRPDDMKTRILTKINAKVWVDKQDLRIAKADATVIDTLALGWIMARVAKGGHLQMEQTRLPDGTWLPCKFVVAGKARLFLVNEKNLDQTVTFDNFKRTSLKSAEVSRN